MLRPVFMVSHLRYFDAAAHLPGVRRCSSAACRMFFRWGGADGAHGGQLRPEEKTEPLPGRGLRPGVRRRGRGGQSMGPSRWRAERTLTAAGSANRWGGCRDVGRSPSSAEGASRWLSRGAGIREASDGGAAEGGLPRIGNRPWGHLPRSGNGWGGGELLLAGVLLGRIVREARDDQASRRDGAIPALADCEEVKPELVGARVFRGPKPAQRPLIRASLGSERTRCAIRRMPMSSLRFGEGIPAAKSVGLAAKGPRPREAGSVDAGGKRIPHSAGVPASESFPLACTGRMDFEAFRGPVPQRRRHHGLDGPVRLLPKQSQQGRYERSEISPTLFEVGFAIARRGSRIVGIGGPWH